ncbi:ABC transporter substrate-binding protein [Halovenus sp. HT40]|uniref:ABC transporter substrate-binding protein n=1 Tax=Halovenus sp. HT40 TaxID=3126691 RepID=UPI00300F2971
MSESPNTDERAPQLNRRRLLQGLAATGIAASAAGCFGGGDEGEADPDEAREEEQADLDEIVEGGTLTFSLPTDSIGNYDQAQSTQAADSVVFEAVYDGLQRVTTTGETLNWMASSFEVSDVQEASLPQDYTSYMGEYEIASVTDRGIATFELGPDNLVLARHPDDAEAVANGDLSAGDTMRLLTRNESGDAVDDGVYGMKIEASVHEGITFHNGEELTAGNVISSYDRMVGSTNEGQQFESFLHARATDGADGYDIEMYAVEPDADADVSVPPFWIFPSDHIDVTPGNLDPRSDGPVPVGTGAYEVDSFEEGRELILTRTDTYWLEEVGLDSKEWWDGPDEFPEGPVIDEIDIRFQPDPGQRTAALQDGSIDMAYGLDASNNTAFQQQDQYSDYRVTAADATGYQFMQIPVNENGGDLHHKEVRQAISELIPRQSIVEVVEEGWASPARLPFPEPSAQTGVSGEYDEVAENADFSYSVESRPDEATSLVDEADVETPIDVTLETNADSPQRQDKIELIVGEMNNTDAFEAELQTPADLNPWFVQTLARAPQDDFASRNATATIGLTGGFDADGYARGIHHPDSYQGCCNFFFPSGTFEFEDAIDEARYGIESVEDVSNRHEIYENEVWPGITDAVGNAIIDYSLNVVVANPAVNGYNAYPDQRSFLTYGLFAPYDELVSYIDR